MQGAAPLRESTTEARQRGLSRTHCTQGRITASHIVHPHLNEDSVRSVARANRLNDLNALSSLAELAQGWVGDIQSSSL